VRIGKNSRVPKVFAKLEKGRQAALDRLIAGAETSKRTMRAPTANLAEAG